LIAGRQGNCALKLYDAADTCSLATHIVLEEAGAEELPV